MEVLSLLKFWRTAAGDSTAGDFDIRNRAPDIDNNEEEDSFFDLVFTGTDCEIKQQNLSSPLHIKEEYHKVNQNETKLRKLDAGETKSNSIIRKPIETHSKPQSPISLLKNRHKFRVLRFGFKEKTQSPESMATSKKYSMRYTVVEEQIPIRDILERDNSLRSKIRRERLEDSSPAYELGNKKDTIGVQKYLKKIRPLYIKASRIKFFDQSTTVTPFSSPATVNCPRKFGEEKNAGVFRGACRSLVKNRWTSASIAEVRSPLNRRDDSMLQLQQDGIQSAILYCKRSFSSSSSSSSTRSQECTVLSRSASDSSHQKAMNPPRMSAEEEKRSSI